MAGHLVEPTNGIEPLNLFLTKEALYRLSYVGILLPGPCLFACPGFNSFKAVFGAGDEIRTRDIQLGRLKLYQLSYSRSCDFSLYPRHGGITEDKNKRVPISVHDLLQEAM
jgi:hypothetical protein